MQRDQGLTLQESTDLIPRLPVNSVHLLKLKQQLAKVHFQRFCELEQTDPDLAVRQLQSSEEMFYAGLRAFAGVGREMNLSVALKYFSKSAEQGNTLAQISLGYMYAHGLGVANDDVQAVKWYRAAAEQGHTQAQFNLGCIYSNTRGVLKDEVQALKWYLAAAEQGHAQAQFNLGCIYSNTRGVLKDEVQALKWYLAAAEQGHAQAQFNLGCIYSNTHGVLRDDVQAVKWYRAAAEQGLAPAQFNLGVMYAHGLGVANDDVQAVMWYRAAAEQGHATAQFNLGRRYLIGRGVSKDEVQAIKWYRAAAEHGGNNARKVLKELASKSKPEFTAIYHYSALTSAKRDIHQLLKNHPNQCYDLLIQDKYLKPEDRADYLKFLVDQQLKNPKHKLDEDKLIKAGYEVATFRFGRLIDGDKEKPGRIKMTPQELDYQWKLLRAVPEGHRDYADAQLILSYLEFKKNSHGAAWARHFLNAENADPKRKGSDEFPELPKEVKRRENREGTRRLVDFWREESLKNENHKVREAMELEKMTDIKNKKRK